ncbi:peptidoglycan-binding protein [Streptomyces sp. NPDC050703]|uniref:peptidoglycan-binding protein n=1 Tax=Streptomyces sp. NPDC050703 TaxID=3157218 RepID=UPI00343673CD
MSVAKVLSVAKAEVGTKEARAGGHWVNDSKYNHWYGRIPGYGRDGMNYPWCAVFVAWVAAKAGVPELYPKTAGCAVAVGWFKAQGRFSEYPAVGAQIFFGNGGGAHTGIVYAYDADYVYTYEGNTNAQGGAEGDGVHKKRRARRDPYVYGYGYPKFAEGIKSADPKWAKHAPKPGKPKPGKPKAYEPFPGAAWFKEGRKSPVIKAMRKRLVAVGCDRYKSSTDQDVIGSGDVASYEAWQRKCGYTGADAKWPPGRSTWDALKVPKVK